MGAAEIQRIGYYESRNQQLISAVVGILVHLL